MATKKMEEAGLADRGEGLEDDPSHQQLRDLLQRQQLQMTKEEPDHIQQHPLQQQQVGTQTHFKPISNQFQTNFKPISNQFRIDFEAISNQF